MKIVAAATPSTMLSACGDPKSLRVNGARRVIVVAFDGLDPGVTESLMNTGRLPNFKKLADDGGYAKLATSNPAQTPVAFANIICGADPGTHQIFDFIHRDPNPAGKKVAIRPYLSTSDVVPPEHGWELSMGQWRLPLAGSTTELLRRGPAFWDALIAAGIDTDVYYMPSNYPVEEPSGRGRFRAISGMGTPDLLGSYGEFTVFSQSAPLSGRRVNGGRFVHLAMSGNYGRAELTGPPNFLRKHSPKGQSLLKSVLKLVRDPHNRMLKIETSGNIVLLGEGEWSDWIPVEFPTGIPGSVALSAAGAPTSLWSMVRFHLRKVSEDKLELYVSPLNLDPSRPPMPITAPKEFADELVKKFGRFSTLGVPEAAKALSQGAINEEGFLAQSKLVEGERVKQYHRALSEFAGGCLFFYFGGTDLLQHMFWRERDPQHPAYSAEEAKRWGNVVDHTYIGADRLVGDALAAAGPDDIVIILSDHGFTSFRRGFNLNTWLLENGYITLRDPTRQGRDEMFINVDWSKTKAYGLGMSGLYINEKGREKFGVVDTADRRRLLNEIGERLMEVRDHDGAEVVGKVANVEEIYPQADLSVAPDLLMEYTDGYRASWETVLGKMPHELIVDNLDRWSGTHFIEPEHIPGILFANRKISLENPRLTDIAPTILNAFGVERPGHLNGRGLFSGVAKEERG